MKYIHYGHTKFDKRKFDKIENIPELVKPKGGLWGCNIESKRSWERWNRENEFDLKQLEKHFTFTLKENAKVLTIKNVNQLKDLPQAESIFNHSAWIKLDFEKLSEEYDAIEVLLSEDHRLYWELYGWDCDSILIMNPDIVVEE